MVTLLTRPEPATLDQLVLRPTFEELVCTCKVQPVWSAGHCKTSVPPLTVAVILVGLMFTVGNGTTAMEPSIARRLVQTKPEGRDGRTKLPNEPLTEWLNKAKLSPLARAGPRLVTTKLPPAMMPPVTTTRSLDGDKELFNSNRLMELEFKVRLLLKLKVPMAPKPGDKVPLLVSVPLTIPTPVKVPPLVITTLLAITPLAPKASVPLLTTVLPV